MLPQTLGARFGSVALLVHGAIYPPPGPLPPGSTLPPGTTYNGPGDTTGGGPAPSSGGGGPGAASPTAGPATAGPVTGGPSGAPAPGASPVTGRLDSTGIDLTGWEHWWHFNEAPYLALKSAIHSPAPTTGTDAPRTLRPSEEVIRGKIVPALLAALEKESNNDVVTSCLVALAKVGDAGDGEPSFEEVILRFLKDPNQEIAETAAVSLGILASDGSVQTLAHLALDDEQGRELVGAEEVAYRTRAFAAYGLGLSGHRTRHDAIRTWIAMKLVEILERPKMATPDQQVAAMVALGLVPVDPEAGADRRETARSSVPLVSSRQDQLRFLIAYFADDRGRPYQVRAHAPRAMARLLSADVAELRADVVEGLLAALGPRSTERNEVRQSAILALGQIGDADGDPLDQRIRQALMDAIASGGDEQSKRFAAIALAQVGGRPGADDSGYAAVKKDLASKLARSGGGMSRLKPWLGLSLGVLQRARIDNGLPPDRDVAEALRTALAECATPADLGAYCIGAGVSRDGRAVDIVMEKLRSSADDRARGMAALALGLLGAREAVAPMQAIVRESRYRPDLLRQTSIALALLGDKSLVPELVAMLEHAKSLSSQAAIASALGHIGDVRSVDPLVALLGREDVTASARAFAAVALGIVADKETLPWSSKIAVDVNYRASSSTLTDPSGKGILDIL